MILSLIILALAGLSIALYGYIEEKRARADVQYHAMCDLSDRISCSKVFLSPYGSLLGMSNALVGAFYYAFVLIATLLGFVDFIFYSAIAAIIVSCYLAYLLIVKIKAYCVVCTSLYLINIGILVVTYLAR
jgi:vitamin-K-epoxide reductase (warfarin-sensitive)